METYLHADVVVENVRCNKLSDALPVAVLAVWRQQAAAEVPWPPRCGLSYCEQMH